MTEFVPLAGPGSLLRGLIVQGEVVFALILRETRTRFGAYRMGYLWALLEPVLMILTFFVFFRAMHRAAPKGMDLFSFIATGIMPYNLFIASLTRVAESVNGNKALLFYPQVQPIDLAIARALLELATHLGVFFVLMAGHALVRQELVVDRVLTVLGGFALAGAVGAAVGLVFCGLSQFTNIVDRARGPLLRPLFWFSGIFFTAASLPDVVRPYMMWNPVLHCTELVRAGWFESYAATYADPRYVITIVLLFALAGLSLERIVRGRIELS